MNMRANILGVGVGEKTKRIDLPREEWVTVEKPELCIVEQEVFELAQRLRKSRMRRYQPDKNGNIQGRFVGKHLFQALSFVALAITRIYSDIQTGIKVLGYM